MANPRTLTKMSPLMIILTQVIKVNILLSWSNFITSGVALSIPPISHTIGVVIAGGMVGEKQGDSLCAVRDTVADETAVILGELLGVVVGIVLELIVPFEWAEPIPGGEGIGDGEACSLIVLVGHSA